MTLATRKKVLFLITKSNWGGAQRYVYDLATLLDPAQFDVVVALGGNGTLVEMLGHAGINTIPLTNLKNSTSLKESWSALRELYRILRKEKPHILHLNSSVAGLIGAISGRLVGIPRIIFTAHGWAFNEDRPRWQKIIIKTLHWITVIFSHRTIAVSSAIVNELKWPGVEQKMKIINPGRTIGAMYGKTEARSMLANFCPQLENIQNDKWIITIAELHPIKRLGVLIKAAKKLDKNIRFVIIGDGQEKEKLQSEIAENKLGEQVILTGAITEAARFLKAADIFVLPSKSESYGYVVHEAGLAGVPIIATAVGGISDIISNPAEGTLILPDDVDALHHAIADTLQNKDLALKKAAALQEKLNTRSVDTMVRATSALYLLPLK